MKITLIGAGNLAWHLGSRLHEVGLGVVEVFSREEEKAKDLSQAIDCKYVTNLQLINKTSDLYIIAVPDSAIAEVAEILSKNIPQKALVVHTSGATPSAATLGTFFQNYGVLYPLQSFSKSKKPNFLEIPICIFANTEIKLKLIEIISHKISDKVFYINDQKRAILHLAAVFVNNFTNHLFHIAEQLLEKEKISFDLLKPLITETVRKIELQKPHLVQTGPAKRRDFVTIHSHEELLKNNNYLEYLQIYKSITESILGNTH